MFNSHTLVTGGTFNHQTLKQRIENLHVYGPAGKGGFERLQEATAPRAFHDSGERFDPPKCHPNTRMAVLDRIMNWVLGIDADINSRRAFLLWLYGSAGAGKSAIAQTMAELCHANDTLLASFFFSRTDPSRNHAGLFVATLSYQIALKIPQAKELIIATIDHDPLIFTKSLESQFRHLIFDPLNDFLGTTHSNTSKPSQPLIIIDGLDECEDKKLRCEILRVLFTAHRKRILPPTLHFLITSRPELDIQSIIDSQNLDVAPTRLVLDDACHPDEDIKRFLVNKLNEIRATHPHRDSIPAQWPSQPGQFIYASTIIKYVSSITHKPTQRLDVILGLRVTHRDAPFADLDALYEHIFSAVENINTVLQVLGLRILGRMPNVQAMEEFLGIEPGDIRVLFSNLGSLISFEPQSGVPNSILRILHASLKDFLLDDSRSKELCIHPARRHAEYAHFCFQYAKRNEADFLSSMGVTVLDSLIHHCEKSIPTSDLHRDIMEFSFEMVYQSRLSEPRDEYGVNHFIEFLAAFLSWLSKVSRQWGGGEVLYKVQQRHFDRFLSRHLDNYYSSPLLTTIVTAVAFDISKREDLAACDSLMNDFEDLDLHQLDLRYIFGDALGMENRIRFKHHICEFLHDSTRSGPYKLTKERYANAALHVFKLLCGDFSSVMGGDVPDHLSPHIQQLFAYNRSAHLQFLAMLLDKAGRSASLLDYIADHRMDLEEATLVSPTSTDSLISAQASVIAQVRRFTGEDRSWTVMSPFQHYVHQFFQTGLKKP